MPMLPSTRGEGVGSPVAPAPARATTAATSSSRWPASSNHASSPARAPTLPLTPRSSVRPRLRTAISGAAPAPIVTAAALPVSIANSPSRGPDGPGARAAL